MKTQVLNLMDTEISKPLQDHDDRDMPITLSLLEQHQEQQQQLHIDRVHRAYQALAAVADRLNSFDTCQVLLHSTQLFLRFSSNIQKLLTVMKGKLRPSWTNQSPQM